MSFLAHTDTARFSPWSTQGTPAARFERFAREVERGLPSIKPDLDVAVENQAFYDTDAEQYLPRREAESVFDWEGRPKRTSGITKQGIDILTQHLYAPGPSRQFDDPAGEKFLHQVWTDNLFDDLMARADGLATLNTVCAIQVDAGEGDFADKPITLRLWGRQEFHVWTDPNDVSKPLAVVTIDREDLHTRYRLWNDTEVRTYLTQDGGGTAGGLVAREDSRQKHAYGCLPFGFVHYDLPVQRFFTPSPGTHLRKAERSVNDRLSLLDESIRKHLNPVPVAENVPLEWNPIIEPQRFIRLFSAGPAIGSDGGFAAGQQAALYYLQAHIDIAGAWEDCQKFIDQTLGAVGIPLKLVRMETVGVASGIALIADQAPLLTRARRRRGPFNAFEARLAKTILTCAANNYKSARLGVAATKGMLTLAWPEPTIPIPGPDRDQADANAIALGVRSRLMIIQERYGCGRNQAIEILKQIAEDRELEQEILGEPDPAEQVAEADGSEPDAEDETDEQGKGGSDEDSSEGGTAPADSAETDATKQGTGTSANGRAQN